MPRKSNHDDPPTLTMPIASIKIGPRHRRDLGDIPGLARSIDDIGLLHPVVVTPLGELIAGERRIAACRELGWTSIPITVFDLDEIVRGEAAENAQRKDFTPSEIASIAAALRPLEERAARQRQRAHLMQGNSAPVPPTLRNGEPAEVRERIAAATGVSREQVRKIETVVAAAERDPALAPLVAQMDERGVDSAYRAVRQAEAKIAGNASAEVVEGLVEVFPQLGSTLQQHALAREWRDACAALRRIMQKVPAEEFAGLFTPEMYGGEVTELRLLRRDLDRYIAAADAPLRVLS